MILRCNAAMLVLAGGEGQRLMQALQQPTLASSTSAETESVDRPAQLASGSSQSQAVVDPGLRCLPLMLHVMTIRLRFKMQTCATASNVDEGG